MSQTNDNPSPEEHDVLKGMQYKPVVQQYAFNQTGNIFISMSENLTDEARNTFSRICAEVSVFFAAMTKALASANKTLYNYKALNSIISKSNMFVPMQSQDFVISSALSGSELAEELMRTILNVQLPDTDLSFATETINSMAREEGDDDPDDDENTRAANIVFKCESLMGMPMVTVIVANFSAYEPDDDEAESTELQSVSKKSKVKTIRPKRGLFRFIRKKRAKKVKEILNKNNDTNDWHFQKETYLFIPPKYFKDFVVDMSQLDSPDYRQLVESLVESLEEEEVGEEAGEEKVEGNKDRSP